MSEALSTTNYASTKYVFSKCPLCRDNMYSPLLFYKMCDACRRSLLLIKR